MNANLVKFENKKILRVECKPSDKEVFLNDRDFYVRTNPATDKLEGSAQIEYIRSRFKK